VLLSASISHIVCRSHIALLSLHVCCCLAAFLQAVNTNITLPLTHWQLEVRMRWVKAAPIVPTNINELFEAHPLKTKLYAVGLLCSPRWALLWAWLFDREPGLRLLQLHIAQHQVWHGQGWLELPLLAASSSV
jgi:hypothetical protein